MSNQADTDAAEFAINELLAISKRYRGVLYGVWSVCVLLAILAAVLSTPIYRAQTMVAAAGESSAAGAGVSSLINRFSSLPGIGSIGRSSQQDTLTESLVTLRSPLFMGDFISSKNLKPVLFADSWDEKNQEWTVDSEKDIPSDEDAYVLFVDNLLSVTESKTMPGIVTIAIEWSDREQAASWVNELVSRLNQALRSNAIEKANQTIEYLNQELEKAQVVEVRQAIYFMLEKQINLRTVANVHDDYALKVLSAAVAPDEDRFVRPNRPFLVLIGIIAGFGLGVFSCFLLHALNRLPEEAAGSTTSN